ncbi:hypothetical protein K435DRAFT_864362 [Dendrothele bispora CBS 962.96]|uniref:Uncharacterized protein n=1 Tax=Dendrothele bispora (strain CBS 962.96) TaxID=1314807 RepID=A0A4S8LMY9_DENBC|nr:hypothetical protein K435DRAFT_864362 [Dendrothele bispora CBS 962.96]
MNPSTDRIRRPEKSVKVMIVKCWKALPKVVRGQVLSAPNISTSGSSMNTSVGITNELSSASPTSTIFLPVLHAGSSRGDISNRQVITGCTKVGLKVTAAAAEAVPGVGTIIKGTIGAVLEILEAIERSIDNKEEIVLSMYKLRSLLNEIEETPTAGRDENWKYLHKELLATHETLAKLHDQPRISLATDTIVQALQQCYKDIQYALIGYMALSQMEGGQILRDIHGKVGKIELSIQNGFGNQERLLQMIKSTITIMDAIGHEFPCDAVMATDPKFIHTFLKSKFEENIEKDSTTDIMLLEFLDKNQYNLCIDEGNQVVLIKSTEEGKLLVEPGTKIIMNVILTQEKQGTGYECPVCGIWNSSRDQTAKSAKNWWVEYWQTSFPPPDNPAVPTGDVQAGFRSLVTGKIGKIMMVEIGGSGEETLAYSKTSILSIMILLYVQRSSRDEILLRLFSQFILGLSDCCESSGLKLLDSWNIPLILLSAYPHSAFQPSADSRFDLRNSVSDLILSSRNVPLTLLSTHCHSDFQSSVSVLISSSQNVPLTLLFAHSHSDFQRSVSDLITSSHNVPLTLLSAHSHFDFQDVSVLISSSQNVPLTLLSTPSHFDSQPPISSSQKNPLTYSHSEFQYGVSDLFSSSQNVPLTLLSVHSHSDFQPHVSDLISSSHNVPLTLLSACFHFDFQRVSDLISSSQNVTLTLVCPACFDSDLQRHVSAQ